MMTFKAQMMPLCLDLVVPGPILYMHTRVGNRVLDPNRNPDRTRSERVRSGRVGHFMASDLFGSGTKGRVDIGFFRVDTRDS